MRKNYNVRYLSLAWLMWLTTHSTYLKRVTKQKYLPTGVSKSHELVWRSCQDHAEAASGGFNFSAELWKQTGIMKQAMGWITQRPWIGLTRADKSTQSCWVPNKVASVSSCEKKNSHETKPRGEYHRQQGSNFWLEMIECHLHVHTESNRLSVSNKFSRQYRLDSVFPNSWGFEIVMYGLSQTNYD